MITVVSMFMSCWGFNKIKPRVQIPTSMFMIMKIEEVLDITFQSCAPDRRFLLILITGQYSPTAG